MTSVNKQKTAGFTLLETLITLVVLAFGIIGVASMQIKSQQFNRSAYFESQAVFYAHDMLERMRSNSVGQANGYYNNPSPIKHAGCNTTTGCSTLEMAQNDMNEWAGSDTDSLVTKLPGSAGIVCLDSTPDDGTPALPNCDSIGDIYAIKIWWNDSDEDTRRTVITAAF